MGRAFRQGFLPWRKGIGIHANSPAGLLVPSHSLHKGTRCACGAHSWKSTKARSQGKKQFSRYMVALAYSPGNVSEATTTATSPLPEVTHLVICPAAARPFTAPWPGARSKALRADTHLSD
jgi:hypothetical protein